MPDTDALLTAYLDRYWGYGSLDALWWFVGMEEGGQLAWHDFVAFLHDWHRQGQPAMRALRPPSDERAGNRWFGERPQIQPYWSKLIRIRLAADSRPFDTEAVRAYQAADLAAPHGDTCLLELLPLPAPSTSTWPYGEHSSLDVVADRDTYYTQMAPRRAQRLRDMMAAHRPRYVVFLGSTYREHWERVACRRLPTHPKTPGRRRRREPHDHQPPPDRRRLHQRRIRTTRPRARSRLTESVNRASGVSPATNLRPARTNSTARQPGYLMTR